MVLQTLAAMGSLHGYGIARRIEQVSGNQVLLNQGTIYASLVRFEQRGWIVRRLGTPATIARPSSTPSPNPVAASSPLKPTTGSVSPSVMDRVFAMSKTREDPA